MRDVTITRMRDVTTPLAVTIFLPTAGESQRVMHRTWAICKSAGVPLLRPRLGQLLLLLLTASTAATTTPTTTTTPTATATATTTTTTTAAAATNIKSYDYYGVAPYRQ